MDRGMKHRRKTCSARGAAIVEAVIAVPILLAVILGAIQFGLVYEAKATLNHAGLQAARAGAVANAEPAAMRGAFARGLAPLHSPESSLQGVASTAARIEAALVTDARIRILNPTREAFDDFGEDVAGRREIPNDRLHARSTAVGAASGLNLQDANLLKLEITYGYELKVPLVNWFIARVLLATRAPGDAFEEQLLRRMRLPIVTATTVRMQSPARLNDSVVARGDLPELARIPAHAHPPPLIDPAPEGSSGTGNSGAGPHTSSGLDDAFLGFGSGRADPVEEPPVSNGGTGEDDEGDVDAGSPAPEPPAPDAPPCTAQSAAEPEEDGGVLGEIWSGLKDLAGTTREFVQGFWNGIKQQIADLLELIAEPVRTAQGLYRLAQSFIDDPAATARLIGEALGKDLTQLAYCGAYDRGRVLGSYISPAFMLKLTTKLARFRTLERALDELKKDFGCASFAAGTPVWLSDGTRDIAALATGDEVESRDAASYRDSKRRIARTYARVAPRFYALQTEAETLRVTEEHPFWVQGRGWTPVRDLHAGDVVATATGDALVLQALRVDAPLQVFNFSVPQTESYFAGRSGLWVHNANCDLPIPYRAPKSPSGYRPGVSDGGAGQWVERGRPDSEAYRYQQQITGAPRTGTRVAEYEVNGVDFDGYDAERNVLIDAKHYTEVCPLADCKPEALRDAIARKLVNDARRQIDAVVASADPGTRIEWHVVNRQMAERIESILQAGLQGAYEGRVNVLFTADIVN